MHSKIINYIVTPSGVQVDNNILRITHAMPEDRGLYVCTAENIAGRGQAAAILEVERECLVETPGGRHHH